MAGALKLEFVPFSKPVKGVLVVFCDEGLNFGSVSYTHLTLPTTERV